MGHSPCNTPILPVKKEGKFDKDGQPMYSFVQNIAINPVVPNPAMILTTDFRTTVCNFFLCNWSMVSHFFLSSLLLLPSLHSPLSSFLWMSSVFCSCLWRILVFTAKNSSRISGLLPLSVIMEGRKGGRREAKKEEIKKKERKLRDICLTRGIYDYSK